ncbi:MAG TPA: tol-pal system protein YbgF [Xanthobacteraceae bacterium]|nr:tol-pal system protein YbgF [Xanthobacteraceae bacterium]
MSNRVAFAAVAACVIAIPTTAFAQAGTAELLVRIDRLENQIRQLTGEIEQMQYRNQQLEAALNELRAGEPGARGGSRGPAGAAPAYQTGTPGGRRSDAFDPEATPTAPGAPRALGSIPPQPAPLYQPGAPGGRRSDAFDPAANPNAPGAPRVLGSIPPQPPPMTSSRGYGAEPAPYGAGAGPYPGADPGRFSTGAPPRNPESTPPLYPPAVGVVAAAPASSPRELLDLGNGYLRHRDYAQAEETFREFLNRYPSDRLVPDAQFGLGESLFQRQSYQDAATAFVALSKKYENSPKAPDALLRLGQSLAAMNERDLACAAFGDVGRKYPRAAPSLKQAVEREQRRARC